MKDLGEGALNGTFFSALHIAPVPSKSWSPPQPLLVLFSGCYIKAFPTTCGEPCLSTYRQDRGRREAPVDGVALVKGWVSLWSDRAPLSPPQPAVGFRQIFTLKCSIFQERISPTPCLGDANPVCAVLRAEGREGPAKVHFNLILVVSHAVTSGGQTLSTVNPLLSVSMWKGSSPRLPVSLPGAWLSEVPPS